MFSLSALLRHLPAALRAVFGLALVAAAALLARSWIDSRDAAVALKTTLAAQQQILQQAQAREQQSDDSLARTLAAITAAKDAVKTPAQAAAAIPQLLPQLPAPEPIQIQIPAPQAAQAGDGEPASAQAGEPHSGEPATAPPAVATVPQADLKPLSDYLQDCRACQAQLSTAQSDLTDEKSKNTALTAERDVAVKAAHGGGFWSRLEHNAKWFVIGGAIGALAATATEHH